MKEVLKGYYVTECGQVFNARGKLLSPSDNGRGYLVLGLFCEGKRKTIGVHKLVALAYVPNPNGLPEVNHKDGNKLNNNMSNLEWTTRSENIRHAYVNKLRSATGELNVRCLTNEDVVREICELLVSGLSCAEIRDLGYNYSLTRKIKAKQNWVYISSEYDF